MRLYTDAVLNRAAGMGGGGLDEVRWLVPTRPGDVLTGTLTVREARPSSHRPDRGTVFFESRLVNQDGGVAVQLSGRGYVLGGSGRDGAAPLGGLPRGPGDRARRA